MATGTTAAPNSTTLSAEIVSDVPGAPAEESPAPDPTSTAATPATPATAAAAVAGTENKAAPPPPEQSAVQDDKEKVGTAPSTPIQKLWELAKANGHPEIWGVTLADPETHVPTQIILQKYINANDGDQVKAEEQLTKTLEWRSQTKPLELVGKKYPKAKFDGLGYVTTYGSDGDASPESREIFTWNIYGGVKSIEETFTNVPEFLEWRIALMELALQALDLANATKPITADYDPYKIFQVHDYKSISFLRSPPQVKAASQETIKVLAQNYPELLKEKFFVNVPAIMGFVYTFMKLFVAAKTIKKFHPMSNGSNLAQEFGGSKVTSLGNMLPKEYGGTGEDLKNIGKEPSLE